MQASIVSDSEQTIWDLLEQVKDPEVPVISIVELGIVRAVSVTGEAIEVTITPTYSGCPAMPTITEEINTQLHASGFSNVTIKTVLAPPWTTDWISASGRQKLNDYGIAPPPAVDNTASVVPLIPPVRCPRCQSLQTRQISEFGSTACKALYQCNHCLEPFDYFKPL